MASQAGYFCDQDTAGNVERVAAKILGALQ
jgi:hypothetical protein